MVCQMQDKDLPRLPPEAFSFILPMPPSENNLYPTGWHGKRIRSRALEDYRKGVIIALRRGYCGSLTESVKTKIMQSWIKEGYGLKVDASFYFKSLTTKKGSVRRIDVSNRLKALHDALAIVFQIDDRYFWDVSAKKNEIKMPAKDEYVHVMVDKTER